jgi:hypothetical protein
LLLCPRRHWAKRALSLATVNPMFIDHVKWFEVMERVGLFYRVLKIFD